MTDPLDIVCVDDDIDIRTVTVLALKLDPALTVRSAVSGADALKMLAGESRPPDAILLDVMMPGMDGQATLAAIRELPGHADVPVIFMTARARQADMAAYRGAGAAGIIVKPFDPLTLARQVRSIVEGLTAPGC